MYIKNEISGRFLGKGFSMQKRSHNNNKTLSKALKLKKNDYYVQADLYADSFRN